MYILVVGRPNGSVVYFGPFKSEARAKEYGLAVTETWPKSRWHVADLINTYRDSIQQKG